MTYVKCKPSDVPANVRFDVPGYHQGQIVEVSYGGWSVYTHGHGAPYMRVYDYSDRTEQHYKWVEASK